MNALFKDCKPCFRFRATGTVAIMARKIYTKVMTDAIENGIGPPSCEIEIIYSRTSAAMTGTAGFALKNLILPVA